MKTILPIIGVIGADLLSPCWASPFVSSMNGRCLDVTGGNIRKGATLQSYECNGTVAQDFEWTPNGEIKIGNLCVEANGSRGKNGDRIGLWACNGGENQRWKIEGVRRHHEPAHYPETDRHHERGGTRNY